jgi:hypothetical protein
MSQGEFGIAQSFMILTTRVRRARDGTAHKAKAGIMRKCGARTGHQRILARTRRPNHRNQHTSSLPIAGARRNPDWANRIKKAAAMQ